jgi:hypothetical protein
MNNKQQINTSENKREEVETNEDSISGNLWRRKRRT